jgi:glycosyltransferase involved in cell wall biosynthesis
VRILFVAQAVSLHTARWINQLNDQGWDIHLFDMLGGFPNPELRGITEYSLLFPRKISSSRPVSYGNPVLLKYGLDPFPLSLVGFFTRRIFRKRAKLLADVINKIQPDVIHSMELQTESYQLLEVLRLLGGKFSIPWIVTTWGSDIYYFKQFPDHLDKIREVLCKCDCLIPDCTRDVVLARELGFHGSVPFVLPAAGAYPVAEMRSLISAGSASNRRLIMLKGYQGWAGRALNALEAIESCTDVLKAYEIVVYLASPAVVEKVRSMQRTGTLNIRVLPRSPYRTILELFGRARIALAVNQTDGAPNAMLEAMTMNALPIQSDTQSTAEWITDGVNGILIDPHDPLDIAGAIRKAVLDDALIEKAAEINSKLIFERLDISVVKPKVINMYKSLASGHKK